MKKITLTAALLLFSTLTLSANSDGNAVYEANCKACHMLKPMMDKQKMMQMSPQERMSMKEKMMKTMKAPPMSKVSAKLKFDLKGDKEQMVSFIKDYIVNPSAEKSKCMPMALKKFGVMPAIGKTMSGSDVDTVAKWMVDNFDEKWDPNDQNMACNANEGKKMKCGQGKCGSGMAEKAPKKESAMKCQAGKCGGK